MAQLSKAAQTPIAKEAPVLGAYSKPVLTVTALSLQALKKAPMEHDR
jgi:hypothetical protein